MSATAIAFPWDIDLSDSQTVKAYEREMRLPAEGTVAQPSILTPRLPSANTAQRYTPEAAALSNPLADADAAAKGEVMYNTYCWPCHGNGSEAGPVSAPGRFPGVIAWPQLTPLMSARTDGDLYLTIRNGGAVMPSYGWAMNDDEMWSLVSYLRTHAPAPTPAADEGEGQ